jgi:WD40 repeat protein
MVNGPPLSWRNWNWERLAHAISGSAGHTGSVSGVAFSPDGRRVVSGSDDQTVKVWDAESGKCLSALFYESPIAQVVILPARPPRLLVADNSERFFAYHMVQRP